MSSVGGLPLHGVSDADAVLVPQVWGVAKGAREPPLKSRLKRENGSCGALSIVVVTCPVCGSVSIWPASFTVTPPPDATR